MIEGLTWEGDHDGHVVFERNGEALVIDRPGDMVTAIQSHDFPGEPWKCAAAVYGVCLAMRGVKEPSFIRQVLEKAIPFLSSSDVSSIHMYKTMEELKAFVAERGDLPGFDLRDQALAEAHRRRDLAADSQ